MAKVVKNANTVSKKKKFKDPYGMFKGSTISEKDIDEVTSMWDKKVDELVRDLASEKR